MSDKRATNTNVTLSLTVYLCQCYKVHLHIVSTTYSYQYASICLLYLREFISIAVGAATIGMKVFGEFDESSFQVCRCAIFIDTESQQFLFQHMDA